MQEKLVIYIDAKDVNHPSWAILDEQNQVRQSALQDSPDGLATIAENKEVIAIVPAADVLLTTITLPKMNRSRLLQALPFALEDQLVANIESLHFAMGDYQADQPLPVAVVSHAKMQEWLVLLQSWNIKADVVTPAVFAVPFSQNTWHIAVSDMALIRTALYQGVACEASQLSHFLQIALSTNIPPTFIQVRNYSQKNIEKINKFSIEIQEEMVSPDQFIIDLANDVVRAPSLNLLQGQYAVKKSRMPQVNKVIRGLMYLGVAWVALLLLYPIISYFILSSRLHSIDSQIQTIYYRYFPQAVSMIAPKIRMEEKLQKTTAAIGENRLLTLLGMIGKALKQSSGIKLMQLDFQNNQLTLQLTASNSENFSTFTDSLTQQGLNVKQQNANLSGSQVNATLLIE